MQQQYQGMSLDHTLHAVKNLIARFQSRSILDIMNTKKTTLYQIILSYESLQDATGYPKQ